MRKLPISSFYFRSGTFGLLSLLAAGINYSLYPILVRILNNVSFGDFTVIIALSNQFLGLLLAFNVISIYLVKNFSEKSAREYAQAIQRRLIFFFLSVVGALIILSPFIEDFLQLNNIYSLLLLAVMLILAVPIVVWTGYAQGHKEMVRIGIYNLGASISKVLMACLLAFVFGSTGGVWGLLIGTFVGLLILRYYPGVTLPSIGSVLSKTTKESSAFLRQHRRFIFGSVLVVGGLSVLQNLDIVLAKVLFSPLEAGIYSGVSIISNALYYLGFLLIWIILPEIDPKDPTTNKRVMGTALKIYGLLAVLALSGAALFEGLITDILLGSSYASDSKLLIFAAFYQLALVGISLWVFYWLILRNLSAVWLGLLVITGAVSLPVIWAQNPLEMIQLMGVGVISGATVFMTARFCYRILTPSHSV